MSLESMLAVSTWFISPKYCWEVTFPLATLQVHGAFMHLPGIPQLFSNLPQFAVAFWGALQESQDG